MTAACRRDCPQGESKREYRGILIGVQVNLRGRTGESATPYREISLRPGLLLDLCLNAYRVRLSGGARVAPGVVGGLVELRYDGDAGSGVFFLLAKNEYRRRIAD